MNKYLLFALLTAFCAPIAAMEEGEYTFRRAEFRDLDALACITQEEVYKEEGLITLPEKFQKSSLESSIKEKELFVIAKGAEIVGFKKLFLMDEKSKRDGLLDQVIQCVGPKAEWIYTGGISYDDEMKELRYGNEKVPSSDNPTYIYNGGDFTLEPLRGRGLNKQLMQKAFDTIKAETVAHVAEQKSDALILVYGISQGNGAFEPGADHDRTTAIMRFFVSFAKEVAATVTGSLTMPNRAKHDRYTSVKPVFEPEADKLTLAPLKGDEEVGAGVILELPFK